MSTPKRLRNPRAWCAAALILVLGAFAGNVLADPPDRVARISFLSGNVSFQPAGDDQWAQASLNRPLVMQPQAQALIVQRMRAAAAEKGEPLDAQRPDNVQRLQMALFPQGAQIVPNPYNRIAGFSVGHAHFFPGFPQMAWPMMAWVLDSYYAPWHGQRDWCELHAIVLSTHEAALTPLMEQIEAQWPNVKVFSLPSVDHPVHGAHIELGVKGASRDAALAFVALQEGLRQRNVAFTPADQARK